MNHVSVHDRDRVVGRIPIIIGGAGKRVARTIHLFPINTS